MKKKDYEVPYVSFLVLGEEDIICNSADTDFPFESPDTDVPAI